MRKGSSANSPRLTEPGSGTRSRACLEEDDAAVSTRNRFPLRRSSELAHFELRVDDLRVFYRIAGEEVQVALIGRKKGNELYIEGKKVKI